MSIYIKNRRNGFGKIGLILVLPFILLAAAYLVYKLFFIPDPSVRGIEAFDFLPLNKTVRLQGENLKSIEISVYQSGNLTELLKDTQDVSEKMYTLQIKPKELNLKNGSAVVFIKARAGILKEIKYEIKTVVDTVPPTLEVLRSSSVVNQGGGGFVLLRARGADSVFVRLEDREFKASPASAGSDSQSGQGGGIQTGSQGLSRKRGPKDYYVLFPAPYDIKTESVFYAVATDIAGNQNVKALPVRINKKAFRASSISINRSFIDMVVSPLLNEMNITDPEGSFKKVNEVWRKDNTMKLVEISRETEPKMMWEGRFLQLKNSKVMAVYGDERTYLYEGKAISSSVHLGYDLASFSNAPVEAANTGIVRFADDLGIYGNTVIIDHGLGLMSLYGHLSVMMVKKGQAIKKGDIIAKTGATGLAGGDHLHFGILIHGYEVSPLYWWDAKWIQTSVLDRMSF
jgi:murein DD-endopeptidase MepM/ murein hydrolase activator NlpD